MPLGLRTLSFLNAAKGSRGMTMERCLAPQLPQPPAAVDQLRLLHFWIVGGSDTKGPQSPAPFELLFEAYPGYTLIRPKGVVPDPHA